MYRNPAEPQSESAVSPWMASILLRRGGSAWQRFALTYHQLLAMPRHWRRQLRRKMAVGLGSAALVLALAGPIVAAPAFQPAAPEATIVVVNGEVANVNNNKCGLIEAIINARATNAGAMRPDCASGNVNGPDTISLPTNGAFVLTQVHNTQFGPTGLPVITSAVTIEGHGATIRRSSVSGTPDFRILAVDDGGNLTLRNVIIRNGRLGFVGGAILNKNALTLVDSEISDSIVWSSDSSAHGGAIYAETDSVTTINGSLISNNASWDDYGAGGGVAVAGLATISGTTITNNRAGAGGGLAVRDGGEATITNSLISLNLATGEYGGVGGGLDIGGTATMIGSTVQDNRASGGADYGGYGGGLSITGVATISGSTIAGNSATSGGQYGCCSAPFDGPGKGGGIHVAGGTATIANSTISDNDANRGGGVFNGGELTLVSSTVTGNLGRRDTDEYDGYVDTQEGRGGGLYSGLDVCSVTTLKGTILSGNTALDGGPEAMIFTPDGCSQSVNVNAHNVFGHSGNSALVGFTPGATDIVPTVGLNAILSPLADNGGPTMTHALPANSPALDRAPNAACTAAPVNGIDQRGQPRNQNGTGSATNNECDVGSFERAGTAALGFYLSATTGGTVGGVAFAPGDILKFTPAGGWAMHFDASDVGITKNVVAFEIEDNGDILLSLIAAQNVPGAGNVAPQDVLRFTPTSTGNNTAGSFALALDGSANLLTTSGEKIDALGRTPNGRLAISTLGAAAVKRPDNSVLKAQDEDALGFNLGNEQWSEFFNGTAIPGLAVEDVNALWIDPTTGDLYISIVGAFNLGGVVGNGRDIVKLSPSGAPGGYTPSLVWDGSTNGFPTNIDGLEMIP